MRAGIHRPRGGTDTGQSTANSKINGKNGSRGLLTPPPFEIFATALLA